jgi:uncharacterized RDD family membrane protein YckC
MSNVAAAESVTTISEGPPESASRWLRFANAIIDQIAIYALLYVAVTVAVLVAGAQVIQWLKQVPDIVLGVALYLVYYIFCEGLTARTIGKWVTGTRVVNETGLRPTFLQTLGRSFGRLIPFDALSFVEADRRGWHDSVASTYVVRARRVG